MSCARFFAICIVITTIIVDTIQTDVIDLGPKNQCVVLNKAFIVSHTEFTSCVLHHNLKTASYCDSCVKHYETMVNNYTAFANGFTNITNNNVTCRSIYFDINPLNIIDTIFKNGLKLWDTAFCKDCFEASCEWGNLELNCNKSMTTIDFENLYANTSKCIADNGLNACTVCSADYEVLNKKYDEIRLQTGDKFCFDIKNMMNETRIDWSGRLHCCQGRELELLSFWLASGVAIVLTAIFYCSMVFDTKRRERIQFIPNDLMPYDRSNERNASQDSLIESMDHIAGPSTSYNHTNNHHADPEKPINTDNDRSAS